LRHCLSPCNFLGKECSTHSYPSPPGWQYGLVGDGDSEIDRVLCECSAGLTSEAGMAAPRQPIGLDRYCVPNPDGPGFSGPTINGPVDNKVSS
jgi:hypothetical protein